MRHVSCLVILVFTSTAVRASVGEKAGAQPLQRLHEWVRATGNSTVLRGNILRAMGLPDVDLAVQERGFREKPELLTHVCAVPLERGYDAVFFAATDERDGSAVVWRSSIEGELISTVRFADGVAIQATDPTSNAAFLTEKLYFLEKTRADTALAMPTVPAPSASVLAPLPQAASPAAPRQPTRSPIVLRSERLVLATYPWVSLVVITLLVFAARPTKARGAKR